MTTPTVSSIVPSPSSGTEGVGSTITLTVTMSEQVTVTGIPELALNDGGFASYVSGSGTNTLTFDYTVGFGDSNENVLAVTSANLNGGSITDSGNNAANMSGAFTNFPGLAIQANVESYSTLSDPAPFNFTSAHDINDAGEVVGTFYDYSSQAYEGYIYSGGSYTNVNTADEVVLDGVNSSGWVVGYSAHYDPATGFLGNDIGFMTSGGFSFDVNFPNAVETHPLAINDQNQIVGDYVDNSNPQHQFGFLLTNFNRFLQSGTFITINDPLAVNGQQTTGINDAGEVVGYYIDGENVSHGYIYNQTTSAFTTVDDPFAKITNGPQAGTVITGINNDGEIYGFYYNVGGTPEGFIYQSGTYPNTVTDPAATGGTELLGVNDGGEVVGDYGNGLGAFIGAPVPYVTGAAGVMGSGVVVSGAIVVSGGSLEVVNGGTTVSAVLNGGTEFVDNSFELGRIGPPPFGVATSTTVNNGGTQQIFGASAVGTVINSGGQQIITGHAVPEIVHDFITGDATSTTVNSGGIQTVEAHGYASDIVLNGSATISGGELELLSGATVGTTPIMFAGSGTLRIDATTSATMPHDVISGFMPGDTIDLAGVSYSSAGNAHLTSGNVLAVTENGITYDLHLNPSQNFSGVLFDTTPDSNGGTDVAIDTRPILGGVASTAVVSALGQTVTLSPSLSVSDLYNPDLAGATVSISGGTFAGDGDVLAATTSGTSITASYNSTNETLTLTGSDTLAHYQQVLESVTFASGANPTDSGSNPTRTVTWVLNDGSAASMPATTTVSITIANGALVIESFGSTELVKIGTNYFFYPVGGSSGPELKLSNAAVVAGQFGAAWAPIGVEKTASGYEVAWENVGANQFTVWNTDSSGNYVANAIGVVSGTDPSLEALESSFQQDLNNDGTTGFNYPAIETFGSTELAKIGTNYFIYQFGGTSAPELKLSGAAVVAGQFGAAWAPIGAEKTASGFEVAWENVGANQFTVWNTDSNGNYIASAIGVVSGTDPSLEALESSFQQDLNGDGKIGFNYPAIETFGSTELAKIGTNYFVYPIGGTSAPELKFSGAAVVAGQFGAAWAPIGAEKTASGFEVAWENVGANQFTVWNTDSNGNYVANAIGLVSGTDPSLESLETSFQQDLNGDGTTGFNPPPIESFGSTELVKIGSDYFLYPIGGPSGVELKFSGTAVVAGEFGAAWAPIGAEKTASGYEVAWENVGANQFTVWNTDGNGNYVGNAIGTVSGTDPSLESLETSFQQDLNGDGTTGFNPPPIESFGATELVEIGTNYFCYPVGGPSGVELKFSGAAIVAGQFGAAWAPIGAEKTASGYEVAWENVGANQFTVWNTDGNGNYVGNAIGTVSGTDPSLEALEPSFQQDLNGDGTIGPPHTSSTATQSTAINQTIADGGSLEVAGPSAALISFAGPTGTLIFDQSAEFTGQISGLTGQDQIELRDVGFGANTTLLYAENTGNTGGILAVSDGTHTANLFLAGQYTTANFTMLSDNAGGTLLYDPPVGGSDAQPPAAATRAAAGGSATLALCSDPTANSFAALAPGGTQIGALASTLAGQSQAATQPIQHLGQSS
jgi:autotransporter passenger strand-loop-strand repeat protein